MTVIDTVGLFDTHIKGQDPIFSEIETYLNNYTKSLNLILFVSKKGRFTAEKEMFDFFRSKFKTDISPISALAITSCVTKTRCKRDLGTPAIWGPRPKNASDVGTPFDPISLAVQGSCQRRGDPLMRARWTMTAIDESGLDDDR